MKELIFDFVTQYAAWGILFFSGAAVFLLWRVLCQQKRLNKSLAMITGNIQAYFDVILTEEEPSEPEPVQRRERQREEPFLTNEERSMLMARKPQRGTEDEEVLNAVFQEFFS